MYIQDKKLVENTILLRDKFGVSTIIETGTYEGKSTQLLSTLFDRVYSCELYWDNYVQYYTELLKNDKVKLVRGNSTDVLPNMLDEIGNDKFILYLDAHEKNSAPLKDELRIVSEYGLKPIIIIHDWNVTCNISIEPHSYTIGLDYIKDEIELIYGKGGYIFETENSWVDDKTTLPAVGYFYSK